MFALFAFIVFVVAAARDLWATAPTHQFALLTIGLALLALHLVWAIAVRLPVSRPPQ